MEDKDTSKETPSLTGNQDNIDGTTSSGGDTRKSLRQASNKVKLIMILLSVLAYVAIFLLIHYTWDYGMGIVALIPVIVVAWVYGCVPGIFVALLTFFANILMREFIGQDWMTKMVQQGGGILGTIAFVFIGGIIGRLSDLRLRLGKELSNREKVEKESKKNSEFLENIFNTSADGIMVTDNKGCIVRVNKAIEQILGFREDELIGKYTSELGTQDEERVKLRKAMFNQLFEKGYVNNWETVWYRKDGSLCPVGINITFIKDREGNTSGGVAAIRDITERKEKEEELKKAKEHLDNIIESSLDCIVVSDTKGYITKVNKSFLDKLGYNEEEVIGKQMLELSPMNEGIYESTTGEPVEINKKYFDDAKEATYTQLFNKGRLINWQSYYRRKDNKLVPLEENIFYLYNKEGDITGAVGILRDITERKKFEKELKMSEEKYRSLIENANDAIISANEEGEIVGFNKKAEEIFGYTCEEILGKPPFMLADPSSEESSREKLAEFIIKRKAGLVSAPSEKKGLRKDGTLIPIESYVYTIEVEGKLIITAIIRDITERKEMEKKLFQSEKLKSLGELAGGVAHNFNNVLAVILGRAQLLRMSTESSQSGEKEMEKLLAELKEGLGNIEKASMDGAEIVKRINEFARERDEDKYFTAVNINEIIDNTLDFTKVKWKDDAESKGIDFNVQKEFSSLPLVAGSASELREVFTNLINNAIDAMPQGGDIKIKTFSEDGQVCVRVKDTGVGIASDRKDRIFDPFFTTKGVKSSGLGLSVSYGIISRHRGTIAVDSMEGEGTTFTIKLPVSGKVVEEENEKAVQVEHRKAKILVIEDEELVRDVLSAILIQGGHEVETASSGSQGIELFEKKEFDLVFTDLGMPVMSGWQVAEKVKSINEEVPVALITGWNIELNESELKKSGVDLVVHKPLKVNRVLRLVQEGMMLKDRFKEI